MTIQLDILLTDEQARTLKALADERGINATEVTRRAIAWYKFIIEEVIENNQQLQLIETNWRGKTTAIISVEIGPDY